MFSAKRLLKKIKAFRKDNRITQIAFAKQIGISVSTLVNWERERNDFNPTLNQIINMAKIFGVTPGELLLQGKDKLSVAEGNGKEAAKAVKGTKTKKADANGKTDKTIVNKAAKTTKESASKTDKSATSKKKLGRPRKSA